MKLKGKVALVTGASRGIGKQIAIQLAEEGAEIVLAARTLQPGESPLPGSIEETAAEVRRRGATALPVACDLTAPEDVENLCRTALAHVGRVDILVNNAHHRSDHDYSPFLDLTLEDWQDTWNANALAPIVACKALLPGMIERGQGVIVFVTSGAVTTEMPQLPGQGAVAVVYSTTKAAMHRFAQGLVKEVRPHNIAVILLDPGSALTERRLIESERLGRIVSSNAHSPELPARVVRMLVTAPDPLAYSGRTVYTDKFAEEHGLRSPA